MGFVAIDFETANSNYNSACSIGLVIVDEKEIVETNYFLIQPPTLDFDAKNISIHGLTSHDVKDSPKFPEVWEQIKHYFSDTIVVAHNAVFDMTVLKACLLEYEIELPEFNYLCSIPITTRACRGEGIGRSLKDRAQYFNIELEDHHNALSDAITCAKLVIECINIKNRKSFETYYKTFTSLPIKKFSDLKPQTHFKNSRKKLFNQVNISEIAATSDQFDKAHVFYGKILVFTGNLDTLERAEAMQKVVDRGGILKNSLGLKTDYLVVGTQNKALVGDSGLSTKEVKAYELIKKGKDITILTEDEFIKLL